MTVLSFDGNFDPAQPATEYTPDPTFTEAVEYIGGCVVPDEDVILVQLSLRTAMRMAKLDKRFAAQRIWYRSLDHVDPDHYGVVLDLYYLHRDGLEPPDPAAVVMCRRCRPQGVDTPATVEVFGRLALCQPCYSAVADALPVRRPSLGRYCIRCYAELFLHPNLKVQIETVGRFTGLCPDCWMTRAVVTTMVGRLTDGMAGHGTKSTNAVEQIVGGAVRLPSGRIAEHISGMPANTVTVGGDPDDPWANSVVGTVIGRAQRDSLATERTGDRAPLPIPHLEPANATYPGVRQETWMCRPCDGWHRRVIRTVELPDEEPTPQPPLPYGFLPTCTGQRRAEALEELAVRRSTPLAWTPGTCCFCGGPNTTEREELGKRHCMADECVDKHVEQRKAAMLANERAAKQD